MILYKYVSLEGALAILRTTSLGFTRASHLNDPFDRPVAEPLPTTNPIDGMFANVGAWERAISGS